MSFLSVTWFFSWHEKPKPWGSWFRKNQNIELRLLRTSRKMRTSKLRNIQKKSDLKFDYQPNLKNLQILLRLYLHPLVSWVFRWDALAVRRPVSIKVASKEGSNSSTSWVEGSPKKPETCWSSSQNPKKPGFCISNLKGVAAYKVKTPFIHDLVHLKQLRLAWVFQWLVYDHKSNVSTGIQQKTSLIWINIVKFIIRWPVMNL